jgi:hypothetical protein
VRTFDRLAESLARFWGRGRNKRRPLPPISYPELHVVRQPPPNHEVPPGVVTVVASGKQPKWAMFLCPCGCRSVITLPLHTTKRPHWTHKKARGGRPSLQPSVWRDVGCLSHFVLQDGRVFWCADTGSAPNAKKLEGLSRES